MKRGKTKSDVSLTKAKSDIPPMEPEYLPPLDVLSIRILCLRVPDENAKKFAIKVTFYDQLLISSIITSVGHRDQCHEKTIAKGIMNYDPSDYEKMCTFADNPLIIKIQPIENIEPYILPENTSTESDPEIHRESKTNPKLDVYCCNIDIMSIFIGTNKLSLQQRLQPMIKPTAMQVKSWDNLPLITLEVIAYRNPANDRHQLVLKKTNFMKFTLIGAFNMRVPYDDEFVYTAATRMPLYNEQNSGVYTFNQGYRMPTRFNTLNFTENWESLRLGDERFTENNEKFCARLEDFQNENKIDLNYYVRNQPDYYATIWASFHKTLLLGETEKWLSEHLRRYKWPLEVHLYGENCGYSFMAFIDLFKLLYPGENTARVVVPLEWVNAEMMFEKCGYECLLPPNDKTPSAFITVQKTSKATTESLPTSTNTDTSKVLVPHPTGSDDNPAFVLIEIKLARPFKKPAIPPYISQPELNKMLNDMEATPIKRECTARGQTDRDWLSTIKSANTALRRMPYYGTTDICTINRQLSGTRTRLEVWTSFWQDAAIYVNNNFVINNFLESDEKFKEMTMMAHACLIRITNDFLVNNDYHQELESTLRAARHARQLKDTSHATKLYLQTVVKNPRDADLWRELSTCLQDIDFNRANVCINKSILINPRHALSLLSKACMVFERDADAAEPFFVSILGLYPFWTVLWVAASAYYWHRELFNMAAEIMNYARKTEAEGLAEELRYPRAWERELGDWWDQTPLLPGTSRYYDAADLLLRIRGVELSYLCTRITHKLQKHLLLPAVSPVVRRRGTAKTNIQLAEVCLSRALTEVGESPVYYHLLALCCRMRKDIDNSLCHIKSALDKFGEISYLRSLQGECYHKKKDFNQSMSSFDKAGGCLSAYSILLSLPRREPQRVRAILTDLIRRQPSAYAWMALADDWMVKSSVGEGGDAGATEEQSTALACAKACAVQALKLDRQSGRAWHMLSKTVKPSARRLHCENMASLCGYGSQPSEKINYDTESKQSLCYRIGKALRECRCEMCEPLTM